MPTSQHRDPTRLFAWDVDLKDSAASGRSGVTSDRAAAFGHVRVALKDAPYGAHGRVRRVELSQSGLAEYVDLHVLGQAWRTESGVAWSE